MSATQIGPYTIVGELGRGGMGTVYRARDTRLRRDVALKVLPDDLRLSPARLMRFEHEARVVAALNHPNIAAIYGIEEGTAGIQALVLELVEGKSLAARIAEGRVNLAEALDIARQIAQALGAAHEKGVVHRDLKPANIVITPTGLVKVLDFGVAKMIDPAETASNETVTAGFTREGVIVGTPAYMSPEQARGQAVDKRTDIWAFGCVLYETLTGQRPFAGETSSQTMTAVQTADPDWTRLPSELPSTVRALIRRCLEREPQKRLGDAAAIRFALEDAVPADASVGLSAEAASASTRGMRTRRTAFGLAALVVLAAVVAAAAYRSRATPAANALEFPILPPEGTTFVPASSGGAPALSRDGRQIAYVATGPDGTHVWVQSIGASDARPIAGTEGAACPFWSFDGSWIGFIAGNQLLKISVTGGQPQTLGNSGFGRVCFAATQNRSGTILFSGGGDNTLASVSAAGAELVKVTQRNVSLFDENHMAPVFLPDDRHYLFQVRGGTDLHFELAIGELGSNERRVLLKDVTNARYAPPIGDGPGHIVYVRDGKLTVDGFDLASMSLVESRMTLAENVVVGGGGALGDFDVSSNGVLAYRSTVPGKTELKWFDQMGNVVGTLGDRAGNPRGIVRVSPDDTFLAFTRMGDAGQDVWISDISTGKPFRFTQDGGRSPVWSPGGSHVAYLSGDAVYIKPMTGGSAVRVWGHPDILAIQDWSGDGKFLLITRWDTSKPGTTGRGLWLIPNPLDPKAPHDPSLFALRAGGGRFGPRVGRPRLIAFGSGNDVRVRSMPGEGDIDQQVSESGGSSPRWSADGTQLYFRAGEPGGRRTTMMVAKIYTEPSFRVGLVRKLFEVPYPFMIAAGQHETGYDMARDGRFVTAWPESDTPPRAITIVMNWQSRLRPRLGN
jgi:Tol biopolymer transport system component